MSFLHKIYLKIDFPINRGFIFMFGNPLNSKMAIKKRADNSKSVINTYELSALYLALRLCIRLSDNYAIFDCNNSFVLAERAV